MDSLAQERWNIVIRPVLSPYEETDGTKFLTDAVVAVVPNRQINTAIKWINSNLPNAGGYHLRRVKPVRLGPAASTAAVSGAVSMNLDDLHARAAAFSWFSESVASSEPVAAATEIGALTTVAAAAAPVAALAAPPAGIPRDAQLLISGGDTSDASDAHPIAKRPRAADAATAAAVALAAISAAPSAAAATDVAAAPLPLPPSAAHVYALPPRGSPFWQQPLSFVALGAPELLARLFSATVTAETCTVTGARAAGQRPLLQGLYTALGAPAPASVPAAAVALAPASAPVPVPAPVPTPHSPFALVRLPVPGRAALTTAEYDSVHDRYFPLAHRPSPHLTQPVFATAVEAAAAAAVAALLCARAATGCGAAAIVDTDAAPSAAAGSGAAVGSTTTPEQAAVAAAAAASWECLSRRYLPLATDKALSDKTPSDKSICVCTVTATRALCAARWRLLTLAADGRAHTATSAVAAGTGAGAGTATLQVQGPPLPLALPPGGVRSPLVYIPVSAHATASASNSDSTSAAVTATQWETVSEYDHYFLSNGAAAAPVAVRERWAHLPPAAPAAGAATEAVEAQGAGPALPCPRPLRHSLMRAVDQVSWLHRARNSDAQRARAATAAPATVVAATAAATAAAAVTEQQPEQAPPQHASHWGGVASEVMWCESGLGRRHPPGAAAVAAALLQRLTASGRTAEDGSLTEAAGGCTDANCGGGYDGSNPVAQKGEGRYLCTGLDLYLLREPCMQCAMGALHARFRRIFFIHASPTHGGLGSVFGLQSNQYVNHRFEVYQILYEQQQQQQQQPAGTA